MGINGCDLTIGRQNAGFAPQIASTERGTRGTLQALKAPENQPTGKILLPNWETIFFQLASKMGANVPLPGPENGKRSAFRAIRMRTLTHARCPRQAGK